MPAVAVRSSFGRARSRVASPPVSLVTGALGALSLHPISGNSDAAQNARRLNVLVNDDFGITSIVCRVRGMYTKPRKRLCCHIGDLLHRCREFYRMRDNRDETADSLMGPGLWRARRESVNEFFLLRTNDSGTDTKKDLIATRRARQRHERISESAASSRLSPDTVEAA